MPGADFIVSLSVFAVSTLITPGPNNMMVAASGVNFGFARTRAHIVGICVGFSAMTFLVGIGLGSVFRENPLLHSAMRYLGFAFLCWIAWRIAFADIEHGGRRKRPMSFIEAALFQWVNPKAWTMAAGATTTFMTAGGNPYQEATLIAGVFLLFSLPCISMWAKFGAGIGGYLKQNRRWLRCFNVAMALILVAAMLPALFA